MILFVARINDTYGGTWNIKTEYIVPATSILVASILQDTWLASSYANDNKEGRATFSSAGKVTKIILIVSYMLFSGAWLIAKRAQAPSAVTREAAYVSLMTAFALIGISIASYSGFIVNRERWLQKQLSKKGLPVATAGEIEGLIDVHSKNSLRTGGPAKPLYHTSNGLRPLDKQLAGAIKAAEVLKRNGIEGNPVSNTMKAIFGKMSVIENTDGGFFTMPFHKWNALKLKTYGALTPFGSIDIENMELDKLEQTHGYVISTKDLMRIKNNSGGKGEEFLDGLLSWFAIPVGSIAAFSVARMGFALIYTQSQLAATIFWAIETIPPLALSAHYGFGYWWSFYSLNFLWFFIVGMLQPLILGSAASSQVWNEDDFYLNRWNTTGSLYDADQQAAVLDNAELISGIGAGVSGWYFFGYIALGGFIMFWRYWFNKETKDSK